MKIAGIVAGGKGTRMGNGDLPKQFFDLCGKPVIIHTMEKFILNKNIDAVIVGINPLWTQYMNDIYKKYFNICLKPVIITDGGNDRNETIINIISAAKNKLTAQNSDILLTHDAVRPFVSDKMICDSIEAMKNYEISTVAIPSSDTMVSSENGKTVNDFPIRSQMFREQTPQTFKIGTFEKVYVGLEKNQRENITDACKLFYMNGYEVKLIDGDEKNIKITYPYDYEAAKIICKSYNNL